MAVAFPPGTDEAAFVAGFKLNVEGGADIEASAGFSASGKLSFAGIDSAPHA